MNKKAEFTTQGLLISILFVGLVMGVFGAIILSSGDYYDITGYDNTELGAYDYSQNLTETLQIVYADVDTVTVDASWFDFFSGIWSKFLAPFQFIYRSFGYVISMMVSAVGLFKLFPEFAAFGTSLLLVLVVVGIVLIKFGLGRNK